MAHLGSPPSEGAPGARISGPRGGAGDESGREAAGLAVTAAAVAAAQRLSARLERAGDDGMMQCTAARIALTWAASVLTSRAAG